jgi:hypothetical protein
MSVTCRCGAPLLGALCNKGCCGVMLASARLCRLEKPHHLQHQRQSHKRVRPPARAAASWLIIAPGPAALALCGGTPQRHQLLLSPRVHAWHQDSGIMSITRVLSIDRVICRGDMQGPMHMFPIQRCGHPMRHCMFPGVNCANVSVRAHYIYGHRLVCTPCIGVSQPAFGGGQCGEAWQLPACSAVCTSACAPHGKQQHAHGHTAGLGAGAQGGCSLVVGA